MGRSGGPAAVTDANPVTPPGPAGLLGEPPGALSWAARCGAGGHSPAWGLLPANLRSHHPLPIGSTLPPRSHPAGAATWSHGSPLMQP